MNININERLLMEGTQLLQNSSNVLFLILQYNKFTCPSRFLVSLTFIKVINCYVSERQSVLNSAEITQKQNLLPF